MDRPVAVVRWKGGEYYWRKGALATFRPVLGVVDWTWDAVEFV